MPDLGKYADTVLAAYAVSLALILGLVLVSVIRSSRVKKQLEAIDKKVKSDG
ncbi:MAG: heme exporter protein CcmD [Roseovarius sp.]|nr:heme exporter protein CcmD [Roseovarius sp.]